MIESPDPELKFSIEVRVYDPAPSSDYEKLVNIANIKQVILNSCEDGGDDAEWRMLYVKWNVNYPTASSDRFEGIWIVN